MINRASVEAVRASKFSTQFRRPLYDSYCFSRIPATVGSLLGLPGSETLPSSVLEGLDARYDKVLLFLVDAFGWTFFERYQDRYPFLKRFVDQGAVSMLTTQFPSTTSAHVTTIHTGQRVDQHGVFEWFYYEPQLDAMIAPLLFSYAGQKKRDGLVGIADPKQLFPSATIYQRLRDNGTASYIFQSKEYDDSPYSNVVFDGVSHRMPFTTIPEAFVNLEQAVFAEKGRAYFYFYHSGIDSVCHLHGPQSPQFEAEIDAFFTLAEQFIRRVEGRCGKTLFLMTADHGQTAIDPAATIYLDRALPESREWIRRNSREELLVPAGSPRDLFLYIKPEHIGAAEEALRAHLAGRADVFRCDALIRDGLFGDSPSHRLRARMADLVILPYAGESVWWYEEGAYAVRYHGHHGNLSSEEAETIFLAVPL